MSHQQHFTNPRSLMLFSLSLSLSLSTKEEKKRRMIRNYEDFASETMGEGGPIFLILSSLDLNHINLERSRTGEGSES